MQLFLPKNYPVFCDVILKTEPFRLMPCKYRTNLFILLFLCYSLMTYAQETDTLATQPAQAEQLGKGKGANKIPVTDSIRQRFA